MTISAKDQLRRLAQLRSLAHVRSSYPSGISSVVSIILGGGQGTRLFPLTQSCCKPALLFAGRYRLIDVPISNSLNCGINKVFVLTQFLARPLHKHIFQTYRQDPFFPGFVEVLSAEQRPGKTDWFQGTADAVRQNVEYLLETPAEYFLILSGDQLYRLDFDKMMQCVNEHPDVDVWVATLAVTAKEATRMGIMKINEDHHIVDFYEKPNSPALLDRMKTPDYVLKKMGLSSEGKEFLGSMGIYLFKRNALLDLLAEDPRDDFGKHLIPTQVKKGNIAAFIHEGYWEDIGTIDSFYHANLALNTDTPPFECHNECHPMLTTPSHLPGPKFGNAHITSSSICDGCIIEADEITNSILGQRTVIKPGTIVRDSYIMGNEYYQLPHETTDDHIKLPQTPTIGRDCVIKRVIIDQNVCIGDRVKLINKNNHAHYDGGADIPLYVRDGIVVIPRGATIPDDFIF
jgi:glucose-1-phosphate adenylyltransferase